MIDLIKFDVNNDFFQTTQLKLKKKNARWKYKYLNTDIVLILKTPQIICKCAWGILVRVNLFLKEKL